MDNINRDFKILVQCVNKRPEEYAEKLIKLEAKVEEMKILESRFDRVMSIVDEVYNSGDYSTRTESLLRKILWGGVDGGTSWSKVYII